MADDGRRRATLADVAARTGYSRALVSIVMREAPGASEATRARVLAAAAELGYRPDPRARSLRGRRAWSLGVIFGIARPFHLALLDGLYAAAEDRGYGLQLSAMTPGRTEAQAIASLQELRFDGLVMLGPPTTEPAVAGTRPVAVIGWHVGHPDVDSIRTSDDIGMELAVAHLVERGHRRIAHIDGGDNLISDSRRDGFLRAMRRHGLADTAQTIAGGEVQVDGVRAAHRLLGLADRPTAVIGFNDDTAVAAITVFQQSGLDVPRDISVIGWDDVEIAGYSSVPLTTVAQQPAEMADLAVERLLARIGGESGPLGDIVLTPTLTVRSSTATIPPEGR
jgi:DNA-binding LacI/PurR family transcriptional regulator